MCHTNGFASPIRQSAMTMTHAALMLAAVLLAPVVAAGQTAPGVTDADSSADYEPRTRHYYIAAEDVRWNYAPSDANKIHPGKGLDVWGDQLVYDKTRYIEYTDASFEQKKPQPQHLGMLGPVIRGVVGDTIKIHFKNKAGRPYSIHPIGTRYEKASEGAAYAGKTFPGQSVEPGETYTYTLEVTPAAGPGPNDPSSILRLYRSHVDPVGDAYRGLVGPMVLTRAEAANPDGTPKNVDREFFTMFTVMDENAVGAKAETPEQAEGHLMHAINGYVFGNLPGLTMQQGEDVRWYVFGMGTEVDLHTPHWHGNGVMVAGQRKETLKILPTATITADMTASNPGTWLLKCNIGDHVTAGMMALYEVKPRQ